MFSSFVENVAAIVFYTVSTVSTIFLTVKKLTSKKDD